MKPLAFLYHEIQPDVLQKVEGGSYLPDILRYEKPGRGDYHSRCRWMLVTVDGEMITGLRNLIANVFCGDVKGNDKKKSLLVALYNRDPHTYRESFTLFLFVGFCPKPKEQKGFAEKWVKRYWQEKYSAEQPA